jgi:AcrR family transcriptional regulator
VASRSDGVETRQKLLEAATQVFARKGFRSARVAKICELAGANVAAVNYHFGSKVALYAHVWREAFAEAEKALPIDGGVAPHAPAAERLRGFIRSMVCRILRHGQSGSGRLLLGEMSQPTPEINDIRRACIEPIQDHLRRIVAELLEADPAGRPCDLAMMSILNQMLAIGFRAGRKPPILGGGTFDDSEIEELIEHICRFSLGGLRETKATVDLCPVYPGEGEA